MFCYLVELLFDAVEAGFESIAARIDCSIPFREVVDSGTNVDIILWRIRGSTCGRAQKLGIIFFFMSVVVGTTKFFSGGSVN